MRRVFLGKPFHWLVLIIVAGAMWWMGDALLQTRNFNLFLAILFAVSVAAVAILRITTRPGDHVTREKFDDAES